MSADTDRPDALRIHALSDALEVGLDLLDLFGHAGDCCAIWLGDGEASMRDFVICHEDRGRDADRLVRYGMISATVLDDVARAVLWRTVDDLADGPGLARAFFDHQRDLDSIGVELVDEIALCDDELRSLAVTAFADPAGWDDITALITPAEDDSWRPWTS